MPRSACHPDRKHHSRGLCRTCYQAELKARGGGPRCVNHPNKRSQARGLCPACYQRMRRSSSPEECRAYTRAYESDPVRKAVIREQRRARYYASPKARLAAAAWRAANAYKAKEINKRSRLKRQYGLTPEQDAALGNACAICERDCQPGKGTRRRHIDHCHATGRVRGVLCQGCNMALGLMQDDPKRLRRAAEYVRK